LQVKNGDINAVLNSLIENEDLDKLESSSTWDSSLFETDRDGNANLHPLGNSAAPTRGNSPVPSLGITAPKNKADEDEELAKVLAMSEQDVTGGEGGVAGSYNGWEQESGRIAADGSETTFGPATKKDYDEKTWGVVLHTASELVPDVNIEERVQNPSDPAPRMLKHLPDGDYMPNLLTICHAIPKARATFLMTDYARSDYGYDAEWWKGHSIPMPRVVHTVDNASPEPDGDKYDEFIAEVQRLTAFLDASSRVYASTKALTETDLIKNNPLQTMSRSATLLELFINNWIKAAQSKEPDAEKAAQFESLFTTVIGTTAGEGIDGPPNMTVVDMTNDCPDEVSDDAKPELAELLDDMLWDTNIKDASMDDNFIESPADIVVIRVQQKNNAATHLNLRTPAAFFLDKYLKQNVPATRALRQEMIAGKTRIAKIEEIEKKLRTRQQSEGNAQLDAQLLMKHTLGHFSGQNRQDADKADPTNHASLADDVPSHYADITAKLEKVISSIEVKLQTLTSEKEKTRKAISDMSKATPQGIDERQMKHRYLLRGVATKPHITYVLQQNPTDSSADSTDATMHDDDDDDRYEDTTPPGMQWWRLDYEVSGDSAKITRTKAEDYDVLRAVELEHNSALLVYASEDANDPDLDVDLPEGLHKFIKHDNVMFKKSLEQARRLPPPPAYEFASSVDQWEGIPRPTTERRDSVDSMRPEPDHLETLDVDPDTHMASSGTLPGYVDNDHHVSQYPVSVGFAGVSGGGGGGGVGSKDEVREMERSKTPVHDIVLPPEGAARGDPGDLLGSYEDSDDVEMVEKMHAPLLPRHAPAAAAPEEQPKHDADMGGTESTAFRMGE
jgi:hypothetical protein